jgi:hypothetical protein
VSDFLIGAAEAGIQALTFSPGAFISGAIAEGLGVTEARNLFRSYGMSMSNASFGQLYGQVRDAIGNRSDIAGLNYDAIPDGNVYTPWAAGTPDRYATFVQTFVRDPGSSEPRTIFTTVVTDEPHTPGFAEQQAQDEAEAAAAEGGSFAGQVVLASVITSMTRTVRRVA